MICPTEQNLNRFHDNQLTAEESEVIKKHLHSCQACYDRLAELSIITDLIRNTPMPTPAIDMMRRWQSSMRKMQEDSVRRIAGWLTAAASVVLAVSLHLALSKQANATSVSLADWEPAAIGLQADNGSSDQATAQWIAADLARSQTQSGVEK